MDIVEDFDQDLVQRLVKLSEDLDFVIFEDRKFADIGNTVSLQYGSGSLRIVDWAHITNAHPLPGPGIVEGLEKVVKQRGLDQERGLLLLAEMSSKDNMYTSDYTKGCVKLAQKNKGFVLGFICQSAKVLGKESSFLYMTPGVKLGEAGDALGQQYRTPAMAVVDQENDIVIVGRGVYQSNDPTGTALQYKKEAWKAYELSLVQ